MYSAYGGRVGAAIYSVLYFIAIVISKLAVKNPRNPSEPKCQISLFSFDSLVLCVDRSW